MSKSLPRTALSVAAALVAATACWAGEQPSGGFGIGPGMILIENVRPGDGEAGVYSFDIYNGTSERHVFTVSGRTAKSTISSWEMGYESIPEDSWLRLEQNEIEVAAKSSTKVKLYIKIPDKPEYYNRKFMAIVACAPGRSTGAAVGLVVAARVQIETVPNSNTDGANAGIVALVPSQWMMSDAPPSAVWRKIVKVRNNNQEVHKYKLKKIDELEKDEAKFDRYFGSGFERVVKNSWVSTKDDSFELKPGDTKELTFTVKVPAKVEPGKRYEELVFLKDDKGHVDFIRLRTEIATPDEDAKKDEQK